MRFEEQNIKKGTPHNINFIAAVVLLKINRILEIEKIVTMPLTGIGVFDCGSPTIRY